MGAEARYVSMRRCIPAEVEEGCGPEPQGELGALLSGQDSDMLFAQNGHAQSWPLKPVCMQPETTDMSCVFASHV